MKIHAMQCLINLYSLPEMVIYAQNLLEEAIKHMSATFNQFLESITQPNFKLNVDMLICSFHLIANLISESKDVAIAILNRVNLVEVMWQASENQVCSSKMLGTLVWLAGQIMRTNQKDDANVYRLKPKDKMKLCQIGRKALQAIDDNIIADGCWLLSYALKTSDETFIAEVCNSMTVSCLVR